MSSQDGNMEYNLDIGLFIFYQLGPGWPRRDFVTTGKCAPKKEKEQKTSNQMKVVTGRKSVIGLLFAESW